MQSTVENRRQHKRYKLDNSVTVSTQGLFQIIDISRGGFSFRCPPDTPVPDSWDTDILSSASSLNGFPAKRVWVSISENGDHNYLPTVVGVKFGKLTKAQDTLLAQLIQATSQSDSPEH